MNNIDRYFKGQQRQEEFICFFRHHWIALIKDIVYAITFLTAIGAFFYNLDVILPFIQENSGLHIFIGMGYFFGTIFLHRFFFNVLNYFVNIGIITNMRIIDHQKTMLFRDIQDSINLEQIQNIERLGEGFVPNLLGYGDIKIFLSASSAVKTFSRIPNVKFHFRCINRQHELRKQMLWREMRKNEELGKTAHHKRPELAHEWNNA